MVLKVGLAVAGREPRLKGRLVLSAKTETTEGEGQLYTAFRDGTTGYFGTFSAAEAKLVRVDLPTLRRAGTLNGPQLRNLSAGAVVPRGVRRRVGRAARDVGPPGAAAARPSWWATPSPRTRSST